MRSESTGVVWGELSSARGYGACSVWREREKRSVYKYLDSYWLRFKMHVTHSLSGILEFIVDGSF